MRPTDIIRTSSMLARDYLRLVCKSAISLVNFGGAKDQHVDHTCKDQQSPALALLPGRAADAGVSFWIFVFGQFGFVANPTAFWWMTTGFVVLSFWSSAMEAAFSTINSPQNKFADEALSELLAHYGELTAFIKPFANSERLIDAGAQKELARKAKEERRLVSRHRMASGVDRTEIVGAFASLSVIVNLSLGIVLPLR